MSIVFVIIIMFLIAYVTFSDITEKVVTLYLKTKRRTYKTETKAVKPTRKKRTKVSSKSKST